MFCVQYLLSMYNVFLLLLTFLFSKKKKELAMTYACVKSSHWTMYTAEHHQSV